MTTITPELRDQFIEKFGYAGSSGSFKGVRDEEIMKWVADREALARAERDQIWISRINQFSKLQPDADAVAAFQGGYRNGIYDISKLLTDSLTQPSNTDL